MYFSRDIYFRFIYDSKKTKIAKIKKKYQNQIEIMHRLACFIKSRTIKNAHIYFRQKSRNLNYAGKVSLYGNFKLLRKENDYSGNSREILTTRKMFVIQ